MQAASVSFNEALLYVGCLKIKISSATFKAMMSAIHRLATEGAECCRFHHIITAPKGPPELSSQGREPENVASEASVQEVSSGDEDGGLNPSQRAAVLSSDATQLSLIWGPPGESNQIPVSVLS